MSSPGWPWWNTRNVRPSADENLFIVLGFCSRRQSRVLLRRSADQQEVRPDGGALRQREGSAQNVETVSGTTGLGTSTSTTRYYSSVSVRLGEYNTETDTDCINNGFGEDCAPPPVNVQVEARIAHESYEPNNINQYHDIALLRLRREVKFSGECFASAVRV
jgi:hypothetical protein